MNELIEPVLYIVFVHIFRTAASMTMQLKDEDTKPAFTILEEQGLIICNHTNYKQQTFPVLMPPLERDDDADDIKEQSISRTPSFSCDCCGKTFRSNGELTQHGWVHTGDTPYECRHCHRTFARKRDLTIHIREHTGNKPYECRKCKRQFNDDSYCKRHARRCNRL